MWNTFPVPELDEATQKRIIKAGQKVPRRSRAAPGAISCRALQPAGHGTRTGEAHDALDREVDKAMGAARKLTSERQCQKLLFADYAKLTNN